MGIERVYLPISDYIRLYLTISYYIYNIYMYYFILYVMYIT